MMRLPRGQGWGESMEEEEGSAPEKTGHQGRSAPAGIANGCL